MDLAYQMPARAAHYRSVTEGNLSNRQLLNHQYLAKRLQLMADKKLEQEVALVEVTDAEPNPDPPPG